MSTDLAGAVPAADDLWSAFHGWLKILENTAGALQAGRAVRLHDELTTYFAAFDKASGFVAVWVDVGEPPRGTGDAYMWSHVRDARIALEDLAGFLFAQLRGLVGEEGGV